MPTPSSDISMNEPEGLPNETKSPCSLWTLRKAAKAHLTAVPTGSTTNKMCKGCLRFTCKLCPRSYRRRPVPRQGPRPDPHPRRHPSTVLATKSSIEYAIPCYHRVEATALVATEIGGGTLCEIRQLPRSKELRVRINLR